MSTEGFNLQLHIFIIYNNIIDGESPMLQQEPPKQIWLTPSWIDWTSTLEMGRTGLHGICALQNTSLQDPNKEKHRCIAYCSRCHLCTTIKSFLNCLRCLRFRYDDSSPRYHLTKFPVQNQVWISHSFCKRKTGRWVRARMSRSYNSNELESNKSISLRKLWTYGTLK